MANRPTKGKGKAIQFLRANVAYEGDGCLIWPMSRDNKGYGIFGVDGEHHKAHRYMCRLAHGEPPTSKHQAAHSCGKGHEGCVHPKHLSWKTPRENTLDAIRHGRYGFNSGGQTGKLTKQQVSEIKALAGIATNIELGLIYRVHAETIAKIRRGQTWRKVA